MVKKKYTFLLSGIDVLEIHKRYDIQVSTQITSITDLLGSVKIENSINSEVSMINHLSKQDIQSYQNMKCVRCHNKSDELPIGCPIKYHFDKEIVEVPSFFSDNVTPTIHNKDKGWYEIDGIFCSVNCCRAFILDNKHNTLYSDSQTLLYKLYQDIYGTSTHEIVPAPSWRLLMEYGGHLSIQEFRDESSSMEYKFNDYLHIPYYQSVGYIYDKKNRL